MFELPVPAVPDAAHGVAWLRANVVRFSEGAAHTRRRALVEAELSRIDLERLRRADGHHVLALAEAMGVTVSLSDVRAVAACYQPHLPITDDADAAVARLVTAFGGVADETTANRIGLLVQACDATAALIEGRNPPVPATRRIAEDGSTVDVDLTGRPFGRGRHACPGRAHATALARGRFHRLHDGPDPLVLPNAWDFATAAALVDAGFPAIGTTSLGIAASHGVADAAGATRVETLALARRLARLPVPVTVDIESGFGVDPRELAAELWEIGIAGVNVEDAAGDPAEHARIVTGLKDGAPGLFVNARIDTYWLGVSRETTLARATRYVDAGADGIFVPNMVADREIAAAVAAVPVPVNVLAQRPVHELARWGVRRVSTGSLLHRAALAAAVRCAVGVREGGKPSAAIGYDEVQELVRRYGSTVE
ncbi:isocitrate lyase/PEP mutase family protein [Nocardia arizonensis]|uniref:isocitrate lyase/PEP mutase family protein n=1 Tax=Nocardia arizonensis TaxID=1141647 RepID=UPI0006D1DFAF|nr:isocitrate lyase/phosphoenolpyruvate mutase family protein [Nocardia arizonensis]